MSDRLRAMLFLLMLFSTSLPGCLPVSTSAMTMPPAISPVSTTEIITSLPSALPAFPEAEGFGAMTAGGRGGQVIEVTNLQDSGPGSLRAAIGAEGARIVVFRVAGTIELESSLVIKNPYITIAGQTAPGAGITLRGISSQAEALINVEAHDVVIRFLTLRAGPPSAGDALEIFAADTHDTYNIVIDHNSLSWAVNRNLATWYDVHDISIQWNIFSEAVNCSIHPKGCHSKGALLGGYASDENKDKPGADNISFHHNLMAHNGERNPYIEVSGVVDVVNNVAYNPFGTFSHVDMTDQLVPIHVNYVGNYFKAGPNTTVKYGIRALNPGAPGAKIFVQGNIGPSRSSDRQSEIDIVDPDARSFIIASRNPAEAITTTSALDAYDQVLADAGAGVGLGCDGIFFTRRDAIDTRIVNDVQTGSGKIIDDPSEVGGWLTIAPAEACADSDQDGMPDEWEKKFGFDPADPLDGSKDANEDGYTNIEEFLNGRNPLQ